MYFFKFFKLASCFGILLLNSACSNPKVTDTQLAPEFTQREARDPEAATGLTEQKLVTASQAMVSSANPYATKVGLKVLKNGGSAFDAAVAIQAVLTLVEPQSSGIGGGAFILYWDQQTQKLFAVDGRETAPNSATESLFFENGKAISWHEAVVGGRSVGVPGVLAALELGQKKWGKLNWQALFDDAIHLSEQGFVVSPRLEQLIQRALNPGLKKMPQASQYFYPNGQGLKAGMLKKNPALAAQFKQIAKQGSQYFYQGELAEKIVNAVQQSPIAPGQLTLSDLKRYQAKLRQPICGEYKTSQICGFGPPSSGGFTVLQILKLLAPYDLAQYSANAPQALHLFTQASKLAYADRNAYLADSDFVTVPVESLLSADYLEKRTALIDQYKDLGIAKAGQINSITAVESANLTQPSTSHISIVDKWGNAVSMTTSIEMAFGSTVMVEGFLLNNQLTDFSFSPYKNGERVANRVTANKRPRSSMAPTMVFQNNELVGLLGSPGGSRIIDYVAQTLIAKLDWNLSIQQAINLAKVTNLNGKTSLEANTNLSEQAAYFKNLGHKVEVRELNSGLHAIWKSNNGWQGAADPRREGLALGY
ncbi:gamma-glutamyltransferase [Catenovulum adriaticum]|uniref:Glutathione hydrolase proenzyme n=1 Tax=Catenovulum adriaticum TaxID=2984846 RepID=A0ABY7AJ59_9ALTE|nr:gamma-glutamyltransferase [Catenovulum sp. TS8]WAJ69622.1 gamma-glutamyltransferase [Catenovulum sp. TS8]